MEKAIHKLSQAWLQKEMQQRFKFLTMVDVNKINIEIILIITFRISWFILYL